MTTLPPTPATLPLLPLRDLVVFPHMVVPLFVTRDKSVSAVAAAWSGSRLILLAAQRDATTESPEAANMFTIGTFSEIQQLLKLPDGMIKVVVKGIRRVTIREFVPNDNYFEVIVQDFETKLTALMRTCVEQFKEYVTLNKLIPPETVMSIVNQEDPDRVADMIAATMIMNVKDRQELLETRDVRRRLELIMEKLTSMALPRAWGGVKVSSMSLFERYKLITNREEQKNYLTKLSMQELSDLLEEFREEVQQELDRLERASERGTDFDY